MALILTAPPFPTTTILSQRRTLAPRFYKLCVKTAFKFNSSHVRRLIGDRGYYTSCQSTQNGDDTGGNVSDDWDDFDEMSSPHTDEKGEEEGIPNNPTIAATKPEVTVEAAEYQEGGSEQQTPVDEQYTSHLYPATDSTPPTEGVSMSHVWRLGLGGVVALAGLAGLAFLGHRLFKLQAPKVQKAMEDRQLAKESQQRLADFMSRLRNQTTVDLSAKNLGDEGFAYIVDSLSFNERCAAADFSKNGIGSAGAGQLAQALESNTTLQSLILDTNAIGDDGASKLAAALAGSSRIKNLNISSNNIGDAGATAIAEMLKGNTVLETLEMNGNVVDYDGVGAIAEALTNNQTLKVLALSDNYVGGLGANVLAEALKQNGKLQELLIKGNELGDEGVKVLCEALKGMPGKLMCMAKLLTPPF